MKAGRSATISATVSHLLAWAAFLWIVLNPCAYRGISATPVPAGGVDRGPGEVVRTCAFFLEVNGFWAIVPMFIPVMLTGLALIILLTWTGPRLAATLTLGSLAIVLLAYCGLGFLSFGLPYAPAALALLITALLFSFSRRSPKVKAS